MSLSQKTTSKTIPGAVSTIALGVALSTGIPQTAQATHSFPGAMCKAANLNQALQLAWDQFGARNPNPIGGPSFFVVCPIPRAADDDSNPETFEIFVQYDHIDATTVSCTFRDLDIDTTTPGTGVQIENFSNFTIGSSNTAPDIDRVSRNETIDANDPDNVWNYVCTLHPQTRILGYNVND